MSILSWNTTKQVTIEVVRVRYGYYKTVRVGNEIAVLNESISVNEAIQLAGIGSPCKGDVTETSYDACRTMYWTCKVGVK